MLRMLRTLMTRRAGKAYPIDDAWRRMVRSKMERKGWSQAELARAAHCSPATISELLGGKSHESPLVPQIHLALDVTPPRMPVLEPEAEELFEHWEKLDPSRRSRLLERAAVLAEEALRDTGKKRS
jgi:transcriptional regulator with XRE-family HTH domain